MCNFKRKPEPVAPSCPLCQQPYTDEDGPQSPCLLPACFHTFCIQCVGSKCATSTEDTEQTPDSLFDCPTCNEPCSTPLELLKSDFSVLSELHAFKMASGLLELQCQDCDEQYEARHHCLDCGLLLCEECTKYHIRSKRSKSHELITVEEMRLLGKLPTKPKKKCAKHKEKNLRLYCKTCQCLICDDCPIKDHKGHEYELLAEIVEEQKVELQGQAKLSDLSTLPLRDTIVTLEAECTKLGKARDDTKALIRSHFKRIQDALTRRSLALELEVEEVCKRKQEVLAAQKRKVATAISSLENGALQARRAAENGSDQEVASTFVQIIDGLRGVREKKRDFEPQTLGEVGFGVGDGERWDEMEKKASEYGMVWGSDVRGAECVAQGEGTIKAFDGCRAAFQVKARDLKGSEWKSGGDLVQLEDGEEQAEEGGGEGEGEGEGEEKGRKDRSWIKRVRVTDRKNGTYDVEYLPEGSGLLQMVVKVNGESIQGSPFIVHVPGKRLRISSPFDGRGVIAYIGTKGLRQPFVNPHDSGEVTASMSTMAVSHRGFTCGEPRVLVQGNVVDGRGKYNYTDNVRGSWMAVDLKRHRLEVEAYSLRSDACQNQHKLRTWRLEGCDDGASWVTIREHVNDASLSGKPFSTAAWTIEGFQGRPFQHFRIVQTDVNSSGNHFLTCAGLELYGVLHTAKGPEEAMEVRALPKCEIKGETRPCRYKQ